MARQKCAASWCYAQWTLDHPKLSWSIVCVRIPGVKALNPDSRIWIGSEYAQLTDRAGRARGRLHPGGVNVARSERGQLKRDVAPVLKRSTPGWVRGQRLLQGRVRSPLRQAGLRLLGERHPQRTSAAHPRVGGIAGRRVGLTGHRSGRVGNDGA